LRWRSSLPLRGQGSCRFTLGIACVRSAVSARAFTTYAGSTELFRSRAHARLPPARNSLVIDCAVTSVCISVFFSSSFFLYPTRKTPLTALNDRASTFAPHRLRPVRARADMKIAVKTPRISLVVFLCRDIRAQNIHLAAGIFTFFSLITCITTHICVYINAT